MIAEKHEFFPFFSAYDNDHTALGQYLHLKLMFLFFCIVWSMLNCGCWCPACMTHKLSACWLTHVARLPLTSVGVTGRTAALQ